MSYCRECYSRNGHVSGCPEDDGDDYIPEDDCDIVEKEADLDYDVEWDSKGLKCVRQ